MHKFPMTFSPAQQCFWFECERLSIWGVAEQEDGDAEFTVCPACPQHGYFEAPRWRQPTAQEQRWERDSIMSFVVGHHGGEGTASVIAECQPEDVPGYAMPPKEETNGFGFYAWQVWHEADGKRTYGYVIFDIDAFVFEWYDGANVQTQVEEERK